MFPLRLTLLATLTLLLASCSASYDSPRTGIRYKFEVPLSAAESWILNHDK